MGPFSIGMISTVPPTSCGIATFAAALTKGLESHGVDVVHVDAGVGGEPNPLAACALGAADTSDVTEAAAVLNGCDAVVVQHEYGIYPGIDGSGVLDVVEVLDGPVVVTAHTVLSRPSPNQHRILVELCDAADVVVVMTEVARHRLMNTYAVPSDRVVVIPHGAALSVSNASRSASVATGRRLLTWGLLGPGKGIEWAIEAFARLELVDPAVQYVVAGATHPNVKAEHGERYRHSLIEQTARLGVDDRIVFDDRYRSVGELTDLIVSSDLVVLPYDSVDQVTSGVLVDAVAAGRPVVATAFPHAVELLASGAGLVVPQRDPGALCQAITTVLEDPDRAAAMAAESRRLAPSLAWPAVARGYLDTCQLCRTARRVAS